MSENELLQGLFKQFEKECDYAPAGTKEVCAWAVGKGLLEIPIVDPIDILASKMARALREETALDKFGRRYRVNAAVRITKDGIQHTMWGIQGFAPDDHMVTSYAQRREQIISDCHRLKIDIDVYNDGRPHEKQIQLDLNFTEDVEEREVMMA